MCRALRVLCAGPSARRLAELRAASVGASWELVGGAAELTELAGQVQSHQPDVVVIDADLGTEAPALVRRFSPRCRIVSVGELAGVDRVASTTREIRPAILGLPRPGGPVRT